MSAMNALDTKTDTSETVFTADEVAAAKKLHPSTVRRMFLDEPGVIRLGSPGGRYRKQRFILRIPASVVERVFRRMTVGAGVGS